MPPGLVMPYGMPTTTPRGPALALRMRVWLRQLELDAALAGGADPMRSEELALRVSQLREPRSRAAQARAIEKLIGITARSSRAVVATPFPPFKRRQVQANRSLLIDLAERLGDRRPVAVRGLAITALLLEDGRGPLATSSDPRTLRRAICAARSALDS